MEVNIKIKDMLFQQYHCKGYTHSSTGLFAAQENIEPLPSFGH